MLAGASVKKPGVSRRDVPERVSMRIPPNLSVDSQGIRAVDASTFFTVDCGYQPSLESWQHSEPLCRVDSLLTIRQEATLGTRDVEIQRPLWLSLSHSGLVQGRAKAISEKSRRRLAPSNVHR
jgi:hypothetical protein